MLQIEREGTNGKVPQAQISKSILTEAVWHPRIEGSDPSESRTIQLPRLCDPVSVDLDRHRHACHFDMSQFEDQLRNSFSTVLSSPSFQCDYKSSSAWTFLTWIPASWTSVRFQSAVIRNR